MKRKQKIALLSVAAIPAMITMVPDTDVQASQQTISTKSGSWVNPQHTFDAKIQQSLYTLPTVTATQTSADTASTVDGLRDILTDKFKNYETTFTVKYTGPTAGLQAALSTIYSDFDSASENQFYTAATISRDYTYSGYVNNVTIAFDIKYNTTKAQEEQVKEKIADIIKKNITSDMSDFQKIKTIHDYVVKNATFTKDSQGSPHAAYTLLTEKKGVSQAYALVSYYLLKEAGFEDTLYVTGTADNTPHAWNVVKYNGNFYHLDTAWDEPAIRNASITDNQAISYQYFLRGSTDFPHTSKNMPPGIASNADTSFKDLQNVINPITDGNMLYYVKSDDFLARLDLRPLPKVGHATDPEDLKEMVFTSPDTTSVNIKAKDLELDKDNGWLYFSNLTDGKGYLYKVKTDGTDLTPVVKTYVTDLKISGTTLAYKKADGTKGTVTLIRNSNAASNVIALINKFALATTPALQDIVNAKIAFDKLSVSQQNLVSNRNILQQKISEIQIPYDGPSNIALRIAQLDETDVDFVTKANDLLTAYQALGTEERTTVYNYGVLVTELKKQEASAEKAEAVMNMLGDLNSTKANYFTDVLVAKKAFDGLTPAEQTSIENDLKDKLAKAVEELKKTEKEVSKIIYQLSLLNDQAANFNEAFKNVNDLITPLPDSKKALITNRHIFNKATTTHTTYTSEVNKLNADIFTTIAGDPTEAQLDALYKRYLAFNPAQRAMFISLSPNPLDALHTAMSKDFAKTNTVEAVVNKINALKAQNPNFVSEVNDARLAYEAYIAAFSPLSLTDEASLNAVKPRLTIAEHHVTDIKTIITAITTIPTSVPSTTTSGDTFTVDYTNVVNSVDSKISALKDKTEVSPNPIPADLLMKDHAEKHITNIALFNTAQKNITDGSNANTLLDSLSDTSSLADITAARVAYDALTNIGKKIVTDASLAKLVAQETRTNQAAADEVTALINALNQTDLNFLERLTEARTKYDALTVVQKGLVSSDATAKLEELEKASANLKKVYDAIEAILEEDVKNYIAKYDAAQALYTALKDDQKLLISNSGKLTIAQANVDAAKAVIAAIDALSKDSTEEAILAAQAKYVALSSDFQKKLVTNYSKLESLVDKTNGKEQAETVIAMIAKLDETKKTFALDVKKAREAYDALTPKQKEYVTNYEDLLAAEKKVEDLVDTSDIAQKMIAQIATINNTSASFKADVEAAKSAYAALPEAQQALVINYNLLKEHLATYDTYAAQAKKLEDKINALSNSSPGYQAALAALQSEYNAFNAAQKAFVPEYAVKLLNAAQSGIDAVRNVTNMILALNQNKITFHADVANARAAYNALIKNHGVYLAAYLEEALEKAEALVEKDKSAARKVVNAINSLSSDSILKEIERARRVYNNLTALQRPLVTNLQTLIDFETGKLSYNTSGIPAGEETDDNNENTEETNSLADFAAVPGERTAMTKSSKGDTYTAQIYVSDEVGNSERFVLTTRANVTAIIPPTITVEGDKTGTMAIEIQATSSRVSFKATMGKKPVTFATEVDIILESVPKNSVILRVDQFGNRVPATYTVDGDQYTIKTNGSDTFIITRSTTTFTDILNDSHKEYIEELAARNIIQNDGNGKFYPNQNITRAEFAVMMARALDIQPSTDTNFNDIKGKSYESEVQALYEIGIIQGVNSTTFNPNSTLTRQQAAMMVQRMLEYLNVDTDVWESPQFTDAHLIAESATNAVALMQSLDIVSGKSNGSFDPLGKLTRSQLAKILYKALQTAELL